MDIFNLDRKTAIITGANGGIGKSIARGFANYESNLVLCDLTLTGLEEFAEELRDKGAKVLVIPCDVTNLNDIKNVVNMTLEKFSTIDILVNNAGITSKRTPAEEFPLEIWQKILEVNLTGVFMFTQEVGKVMLEQGKGSIINLSSAASQQAVTGSLAYSVSKSGVNMVTKAFASEWAERGVRVNGIAPYYTDTPILAAIKEIDKEFMEKVISKSPMRRMGKPEEIAAGVLFLASDASSYMTGETISIDGGAQARGI
ncbi:gluconate 5-dehydrogenase [Mesobacillus persicus]|uniref:Gluconate 5-dehydrogenase n=1 Tax=Mesobacillus persicus TaxID=930146 RepID=A0A1H8D8V1_9BACI|nr:SDR family NAD(P)-dependent oxidoreductase [Mesobacillus persicus]SEN03652.1 gluconate 5-dehydrogenase [Mesobacillus persicus]